MSLRICLISILCCCYTSTYAFNFEAMVAPIKGFSSEEFITAFPMQVYLEEVGIHDVKILEKHRTYLNAQDLDGNAFIFAVVKAFLDKNSINFEDREAIQQLLEVGEIFKYSEKYLADSVLVYMAASDFVFGTLADTLEVLIEDEKIDKDNFEIKYAIQRLIDNKYMLVVPTSNWTKLWNYAKTGRFDYIWHKFTSTYFKEFLIAILIFLGLFFVCIWLRIRHVKRKSNAASDSSI